MSGCHNSEKDQGIFCYACKLVHPSDYNCLFNEARNGINDVHELIKEHWDLNYRTQDNLSKRLTKIESSQLSQQLDPKVWVYVNERLDKLESSRALFELQLKVDEFKYGLGEGHRFMECLAGLEDKLQSQIDDARNQLMIIYGKRPHKCPVCEGTSFCEEGMDCKACDGSCIVWG